MLVKELREKIHRVFGEFEQLEKRNEELQQVIVSLNDRMEVLEKEKGELTTRYENLKLAKVLENGYGDSRYKTEHRHGSGGKLGRWHWY